MQATSLENLWNQLHNRLYRFIRSRLPDEADAEDILQDVFLRIHTHLDTIQDMRKLEGWVYQIARNSIVDYYRSRHRVNELPVESVADFPVYDEYPEEDAAESLAPSIKEIVQTLPEPYREALILTEYLGLSQKELADRLGISFSGAKSRVQRARQKVRDILLACCHFEFDVRGVLCCYRANCCCCDNTKLVLS